MASSLGATFDCLAGGADAEMWECAALISAPGSAAQAVHSDTMWSPSPCLFTAFVVPTHTSLIGHPLNSHFLSLQFIFTF